MHKEAQQDIVHLIGNGKLTKFWLDPWLPCGPLLNRFGSNAICDMGVNVNINVDSVISNGAWRNLHATSNELLYISSMLSLMPQPCSDFEDEIIWMASENGKFPMKAAMQYQANFPQPIDWSLIWFKGRINKHSTCAWMALSEGLQTRSLLASRNIINDTSCPLCNSGIKSTNHLFLECSYSRQIWAAICSKFGATTFHYNSLGELLHGFISRCSRDRQGNVTLASLCSPAFCWNVWERETPKFSQARKNYRQ